MSATWSSFTNFDIGDIISPTGSSLSFQVQEYITPGVGCFIQVTCLNEPTWPLVAGQAVDDGGIRWVAMRAVTSMTIKMTARQIIMKIIK